jgi:hypothetical protein
MSAPSGIQAQAPALRLQTIRQQASALQLAFGCHPAPQRALCQGAPWMAHVHTAPEGMPVQPNRQVMQRTQHALAALHTLIGIDEAPLSVLAWSS